MSIELVLGAAATGKTRYCVERYRESLRQGHADEAIFLLPTGEAVNRVIEELLPEVKNGLFAPRILTFHQLLDLVLGGIDRGAVVSEPTRDLLIEKIIDDLARDGKLTYLKPVAKLRGTPRLLRDFITELKIGGFGAEAFSAKIRKKKASRKNREVSLIYNLYEKRLHGCGLSDEQDLYLSALELLKSQGWRGGGFPLLLVDGFQSFTPVQLEILRILSRISAETVITVQHDPERPDLFASMHETYKAIQSLGIDKERLMPEPAPRNALAFLRKNIFSRDRLLKGKIKGDDSVRLIVAGNSYREIEEIAMEVKRLLTSGEAGVGDICVLFRSTTFYSALVREVFGRFGIPVRIVKGEPIGQNALVRIFRSALELVAGNWSASDLLRVLKSGYLSLDGIYPLALEDVSRAMSIAGGFENWLGKLDLYISKEKANWQQKSASEKAFQKALFGRLESSRRALLELHGIVDKLSGASSIKEFCSVSKEIIHELGLGMSYFTGCHGNLSLLRRDLKALERLGQCLDEMARVAEAIPTGEGELSLREFSRSLDLELAEMVYHYDEREGRGIAVMDVHNARPLSFPYVFVGGLLEQVFPHAPLEDPLYRDEERETISRIYRVKLQKRSKRVLAERHLFYTAISRATKRLYLSHAKSDELGKEKLPSYYIGEVERLFSPGSLKKTEVGSFEIIHPVERLWNREDLLAFLLRLRSGRGGRRAQADSKLQENLSSDFRKFERRLYNNVRWAADVEHVRNYVKIMTRFDGHLKSPRVRKAIQKDIGAGNRFSVSRLNLYGRCPFAYFVKYVLRLQPLEEAAEELTPLDRGAMLHAVLYAFFVELRKRKTSIAELGFQKAMAVMNDVASGVFAKFEKAMSEAPPPLWKLQKEEMLKQLENILKAEDEWESAPTCTLRPECFELEFGDERRSERKVDPLSSPDPFTSRDGIQLSGRIDRVDISPDGYYLVIDYKLGRGFDWKDAQEGVDLQIPVYVQMVGELLKSRGVKEAVGGCYFSMSNYSRRRGMWKREYNGRCYSLPANCTSLIDSDTWAGVMEAVNDHISDYVKRIRRGDYRLLPKHCATYCDFAHICRYDEWRLKAKKDTC